jgi:hypothetical protein
MLRMNLVSISLFVKLLSYLLVTGLQFALSPSYCSAVQIRNDGKVKWKRLDYHMGHIGSSKDDRELYRFGRKPYSNST